MKKSSPTSFIPNIYSSTYANGASYGVAQTPQSFRSSSKESEDSSWLPSEAESIGANSLTAAAPRNVSPHVATPQPVPAAFRRSVSSSVPAAISGDLRPGVLPVSCHLEAASLAEQSAQNALDQRNRLMRDASIAEFQKMESVKYCEDLYQYYINLAQYHRSVNGNQADWRAYRQCRDEHSRLYSSEYTGPNRGRSLFGEWF